MILSLWLSLDRCSLNNSWWPLWSCAHLIFLKTKWTWFRANLMLQDWNIYYSSGWSCVSSLIPHVLLSLCSVCIQRSSRNSPTIIWHFLQTTHSLLYWLSLMIHPLTYFALYLFCSIFRHFVYPLNTPFADFDTHNLHICFHYWFTAAVFVSFKHTAWTRFLFFFSFMSGGIERLDDLGQRYLSREKLDMGQRWGVSQILMTCNERLDRRLLGSLSC